MEKTHTTGTLPPPRPAALPLRSLRRRAAASPSPRASAASGEGLVRQLGVLELVLLGIGASIGAGIFVITGTVARDAGPGVTISFALAGAACVLNALCYAELASRFPAVVGGVILMLDYHIGAASIARSLASYFIQFLELIPSVKGNVPSWIGHGEEFFGGVVSVNILAPILLVILTVILCRGVKESPASLVFAGVFEVDVSNWSPFMPNGFKAVVTGSTVVFFAYVGFDAVANSAEEAKRPQVISPLFPYYHLKGILPIGILGSLLACVILYVAVCLDGLLPSIFSKVHPTLHTPMHSQIWVGCVAAILAGLFNVHALSHILSVGTLVGGFRILFAIVTQDVIVYKRHLTLFFFRADRLLGCISLCDHTGWSDKATNSRPLLIFQSGRRVFLSCHSGFCGFIAGISYRFSYSIAFIIIAFVIATIGSFSLLFRQVYVPVDPPRFSCPGVPMVPIVSVFFNMFLFAQLHEEAWYRFVILSLIAVGVYAGYGQYNAVPSTSDHSSVAYHGVPSEAP
ncbi:hypothetical protein ZWY2020_011230 [Hordeum vulgare]|nr:hypothetical protein ZWY2020_011230 [Hordeum vulgare]